MIVCLVPRTKQHGGIDEMAIKSLACSLFITLVFAATNAQATAPVVVSEPSTLSILGIGLVVGILAWRIKRKR